jgi:hypothetical protein
LCAVLPHNEATTWAEQAEREAEEERRARLRQKKARRWVDQRLKDYYSDVLLPQSYAGAEVRLAEQAEQNRRADVGGVRATAAIRRRWQWRGRLVWRRAGAERTGPFSDPRLVEPFQRRRPNRIMRELSASALKQMAELLAADALEDIKRQRRNNEKFLKHIAEAKRSIAESRELLSQLDDALRRFNRSW